VWPGYPLSTAEVYAAGRFRLTPEGDPLTILRLGLTREEPEGVARALFNALEGPAFSLYPGLSRLKGKLLGLGASGALLCGSGSAIFAYFAEVEAARRAVPVLAAETRAVHLALPLPAGAQRLA
jgi:4-diphosphocytidyl-2-C-methyl-D-erythritol kinase